MSRIVIDGVGRDLNDVSSGWINQEIRARQENGKSVCVEIMIDIDDANLNFASSAHGGSTGGVSRKFTDREQSLIDLWGHIELGTG